MFYIIGRKNMRGRKKIRRLALDTKGRTNVQKRARALIGPPNWSMVRAFAISMIRGRRDRVHFPSARRKMPPIYFAWKATTEGFFATAGWLPRALVVVAALAPWAAPARAESAYCDDLKAEIAQAGGGGDSGRYRATAAKQQVELGRTAAYARSIGCERQQFLFFGEAPPPQCAQINARVAQMQANLAALQQRSGDNGRKLALTARYDAQCRERSRVTPLEASRGFFEELFGLAPPREAGAPPDTPPLNRTPSIRAQPEDPLNETEGAEQGDNHIGGALAICVRQCDGGFFPVSYSARRANLDELATLCKALCPNAEVALYTKSPWGELDSAISISGDSYGDHPNALKFQKTRVPACGCKPPDKSWAEALAEAERILASSNNKDVVVTEEQAEQLSRPLSSSEARDRAGAKKQSTRRDAPTVEGTTGSLAAPATGKDPGEWRETIGPDGVKRRVRVVAPTL
jgi:Protein of unknown function (DUF2865)